jgi:hypothetical protein
MNQASNRSTPFMLRLRPALKAAAEKRAKMEGRSLASLFEWLMTSYLIQKGDLDEAGNLRDANKREGEV